MYCQRRKVLFLTLLILVLIMTVSFTIYGEGENKIVNEKINEVNMDQLMKDLIDNNFSVNSQAMDELSDIGKPSISYLKDLLESNEDLWAKRRAITVLDRIGNDEVIEVLFIALSDNEKVIREAAADSLEKFGEQVLPILKEQLIDVNFYVRTEAVNIIKRIGWTADDISKYLMAELIRKGSDKTTILRQLANLESEARSVVPNLLEILEDSNEDLLLRLRVLESLEIIDRESVPLKYWLLAYRSESVDNFRRLYEKANHAIVLAGDTALPFLEEALKSDYPELRTRAISSVASIDGVEELYKEIFELLFDEKWYVRYQAVSVLEDYNSAKFFTDILDTYNKSEDVYKKDILLSNLNYAVKKGEEILTKVDISPKEGSDNENKTSPVSIEESTNTVVLSNNKITMTIEKQNASISRLLNAKGVDIMDNKGYSYVNGFFDGRRFWLGNDHGRLEYHLVRQEDDLVEIKFSTSSWKQVPFKVQLHYVLKNNDQGFYWYLTVEHPGGDMPAASYGFLRRVTRVSSSLLTHVAQSDGRLVKVPVSELDLPLEEVMDATFRMPDDGSVYTKYDFANLMAEHYFHGAIGEEYAYWSIMASNEFKNGGPSKQYNTAHDGGDTQVILDILQSVHFIGDVDINVDKEWGKIYGPFFVYLNSGENMAEMLVDAQKRAAEEREKWPYSWMENNLYPVERGSVTGKVKFTDGSNSEGGWVILGEPDRDWQKQSENYLFWSKIDQDGFFKIDNVREGEYTLYSYVPGIFGEFSQDGINVKANENTDLGTLNWIPLSYGEKLWEIGIPDRSAKEFLNGNTYRQWDLISQYPIDYPKDVQFVIGESDWTKDWNFAQPVRNSGTGSAATWDVIFEMDERVSGQAYLSIAIAGSHDLNLYVSVNGTRVGSIMLSNDSSIHRGGKQGLYREELVKFNASLLVEGENNISLSLDGTDWKAVMYDYLKLEIADS
ncbi:polysaccharide lyase family protein [Natronospora cellulosivora (SeqCode)]